MTRRRHPRRGAAVAVENVRALRGQSTIIAITHRPAFLDIADRVYELSDGQVVATDRR